MSAEEPTPEIVDQRAQVRKIRKWILLIMGGTLAILIIWGMTMGGTSNGSPGASTSLGEADAAACSRLQGGLDAVASGTPLTSAMDSAMGQGWPNGQPSEAVRGVYNAFRSAVAAEGNYLDGVGTLEEATGAFQDAFTAYQAICQ